jgi:hypothetical protein
MNWGMPAATDYDAEIGGKVQANLQEKSAVKKQPSQQRTLARRA